MKILLVLYYGWEFGGGEIYTLNLKKALEKRGHEVKIFSSNNNNNLSHFSDYEFREYSSRIFQILFSILNYRSYFKLKQVLKEFQPDIVHIQNLDLRVTPSVVLALNKIPIIFTMHSYNLLAPRREFIKYNYEYYFLLIKFFLTRSIINKINLFIAPSKYMTKLCKINKYDPIIHLYNGVNLLPFAKITNQKNLLFIGRLTEEKGVYYLLKSMPIILKKIPSLKLTIIGDGPEFNSLVGYVKKNDLSKNISFLKKVSNKRISSHIRRASVIVVPSIYKENLPTVCIEAMSMGRPVIGTYDGGLPELIADGKTGFLVDPRNSEQIAEKIIKLFSDGKLLEQMGKNARKKAEQFSIEKHVGEIEKIYLEVIKKYKTKEAF